MQVHKVDITDPSDERHGTVTEADYVLFKLMQMQKVDEDVLCVLFVFLIFIIFEKSRDDLP